MIFDSADYYFIDFQTDLPKEAAGTRIGMYLAWLTLRGLGGEGVNDCLDDLRARRISCADFLFDACDGKFTADDVNDEGKAFTEHYYTTQFNDDFDKVFAVQFSRTGYALDDSCNVPCHWHNYDRLALVLNRRLQEWRAQRDQIQWPVLPALDSVYATVLRALQPFMQANGFVHDPVNEPEMAEPPSPDRVGHLYCSAFPGGNHWLLPVVKSTPQGAITLALTLASRVDTVAERIRDHGLPEYFNDTPESHLPYTALLRLWQWLRGDPELLIEQDDDGNTALVLRGPQGLARTVLLLAQRCETVLGPLLDQLATVQGLDAVRCTRPLSESILYTDPYNRLPLSTAEAANNPRILELCDELEALCSDPQAPGGRFFYPNLMAHINLVRERNTRA